MGHRTSSWSGRKPLTGLALVGALLSACGTSPAPASSASTGPPDKLAVAYSNISADFLAPWVAREAGIFDKNRLDVDLQLVSGGKNTMTTLLSGQMQIVQLGGAESLSAAAEGADLVVLGTLAPVYPYVFMVPASIRSTADLKNKKVGISSFGGSADIATRVGLKQQGLDPDKDVIIVAVGSHENRTAALIAGSIQGGVDDPPDTLKLESKGMHALFDLAAQKLPAANTVIAVQRSWVTTHRDIAQRYVDSIVAAIARAKRDKAYTIGVLKKYFRSDDENAMSVAYDFFMKEVTPSLPYPKVEQFADAKAVLGQKSEKVRAYDVSKLLDPTFVKSAEDRHLNR